MLLSCICVQFRVSQYKNIHVLSYHHIETRCSEVLLFVFHKRKTNNTSLEQHNRVNEELSFLSKQFL